MTVKLSEAKKGNKGKILKIDGSNRLKARIIRMGIFEGDEFLVDNVTPFNFNVIIKVRNIKVALRKEEAESIEVDIYNPS